RSSRASWPCVDGACCSRGYSRTVNSRSGVGGPDEPDEVAFGRPRRSYGKGPLAALVAVGVLAAAALAVSAVALSRTETASPDGVARHGLSADHAACFAFGLLERRMAL